MYVSPVRTAPKPIALRDIAPDTTPRGDDPARLLAAWAAVYPGLVNHHPVLPYSLGTSGPTKANALIAGDGGWRNAAPKKACA